MKAYANANKIVRVKSSRQENRRSVSLIVDAFFEDPDIELIILWDRLYIDLSIVSDPSRTTPLPDLRYANRDRGREDELWAGIEFSVCRELRKCIIQAVGSGDEYRCGLV